MSDATEKKMTLGEHLEELRRRVIYALAGPLVGFVVCFFLLRDWIMLFILRPCYPHWSLFGIPILDVQPPSDNVILTLNAPYTGIFTYMYLSLIAACILTAPWTLYHLWAFVAAGLYPHERRKVVSYGTGSIGLFFLGVAFFFFVVYPLAIAVLYGFGGQFNDFLVAHGFPKMLDNSTLLDGYVRFVLMMALVCGLMFELPLVVLFLGRTGIVSLDRLKRSRRLAILIIFIVSAIASPGPDVVSQLCLAIPMVVLYELGILLVWLTRRKQHPDAAL